MLPLSTAYGETSPGTASPQDRGRWAERQITGLTPGSLQENGALLIRDEILGTRLLPTDQADAPSVVEGGWAD